MSFEQVDMNSFYNVHLLNVILTSTSILEMIQIFKKRTMSFWRFISFRISSSFEVMGNIIENFI